MSSVPMPKSMMADNRGPSVFFEHVPAMSCTNGVYCFTLAAGSPIPLQDGRLIQELVGVGQIHGTRHALTELRRAIDRILNLEIPDATRAKTDAEPLPHEDVDPEKWRNH